MTGTEANVTATSVLDVAEPVLTSNSTLAPPVAYWTVPWRVALTVSLALIMCGAVVGNSLVVVVVLRNRGMRTRTNLFLCNLAVADLLCAVIDMPFSLITVASGRWIFNDAVCEFNGFAMPFLFVTSIHTLMYMSIHKYLSLASPFRRSLSTRCVVAMIAGAWLWAAAAGASTISPLSEVVYKPGTAQCGPQYPNDVASYAHFFVIVATCYAVPLLVVGVCNSLTFAVIRGHGVRMRLHSTEEWRRIGAQQRHIAITLLLVVVSFAVAWTPWVVYAFYVIFAPDTHGQPPTIINPITYWCIYLNSVCNPVIYALRSEAFREGYKHVFCTGSKSFVSETSSQRSTMSRNCVEKVDVTTAALLNNVVKFSADAGDDGPWASLDRCGRPRRARRRPFWTPNDLDDDEEQQNYGYSDTVRTADVEIPDLNVGYREAALPASLTSVPAAVEDFSDSSTERSPVGRQHSHLTRITRRTLTDFYRQHYVTKSERKRAATTELTSPWQSSPFPDSGVGSALAARASSEGDVLSGVEAAAETATAGRSLRLLSSASGLFGRFVTQTRQRLTTVSGVEWRRRRDLSSSSFLDASATPRLPEESGIQTVPAPPAEEHKLGGTSVVQREMRLPSLSGSVDSNNGRQRSQRRVANTPTSLSSAAPPSADDVGIDAACDREALRRTGTGSTKKRPTVRRYPSVERLDLPRRPSAATTDLLMGADRKRAERFRRQYVDVKLQRRPTPLEQSTSTADSMPAGVDVCGRSTYRDVIARPQMLRVPASADVLLS